MEKEVTQEKTAFETTYQKILQLQADCCGIIAPSQPGTLGISFTCSHHAKTVFWSLEFINKFAEGHEEESHGCIRGTLQERCRSQQCHDAIQASDTTVASNSQQSGN